jgi:hypothetical protein
MVRSSFPRCQQYRCLRHAAASGAAGLAAGVLAIIAATAGAIPVTGLLLVAMFGLLLDARRWVRLAGHSRVGARSEDEVRRALAPLEADGWRLHHSLPYRGRGDIDSVAIAPTRIAFVRDQDQDVRRTPPRRRPGHGGVAAPPAAPLVPPRSAARPVRRARQRRGTRPGRGPDRLSRPPRAITPSSGRHLTPPGVPGRTANQVACATAPRPVATPPTRFAGCPPGTANARVGRDWRAAPGRYDTGCR